MFCIILEGTSSIGFNYSLSEKDLDEAVWDSA